MTDEVHILHVDDDPAMGDLTVIHLERELEGATVSTVTSAAEALEHLEDAPVDCIVSDFDMPGTDGIELLAAVREEHPALPFILFTGKGSEEVAADAIAAGVTDYLQKGSDPSQYAVLANRIENAVDRQRAHSSLAESEQRLSLLIEQSSIGVIEWDEQFRVKQLNPAAEDILGYETADLAGESWETIVPPSDEPDVGAIVSALLEAEGGHHSINENVTADGDRIVCEWHNRVVTDDDGAVVAIFSQFQDITDRVEQRRELERYRTLVESATNAILSVDDEGIIQTANPAVEETFGYDPADLIDEPVTRLMTEETAREHEAAFETYLETGERTSDWRHVELTGQRADGTAIPVVATFSEVEAADEPLFVAILRDVSDIEATAEREARQRALLKAQQEAMLDGVLVVDEDRTVVSANDRFIELWDLEVDDIEGADDTELLAVASDSVVDQAGFREDAQALAANQETTRRDTVRLVDGRVLDRYTTPIRGEDGTYFGRLWTFRDITDRVETERELRERIKELEAIRDTVALFQRSDTSVREILSTLVDRLPASFQHPEVTAVAVEYGERFIAGDGFDASDPSISATATTGSGTTVRLTVACDADGDADAVFLEEEVELVDTLVGLLREYLTREASRARLSEEKRRYETILEQSSDYVIIVDETGTISYASPSIEAITGFTPEEVVGTSAFEYIHEGDEHIVTAAFEEVLRDDTEVATAEYRAEMADGGVQWIEVRGQNYLDDPQLEGILVNARVVSERKAYERELEHHRESLEHLHLATNELYGAYSVEACHEITIDAGVSILGFDWCTLTAPAEGTDQFEIVAVSAGAPVDVGDRPFGIDEGVAGEVYQTKEPSLIEHVGEASHGRPTSADIESALTIPVGDWGVFQAVSTESGAFDEADLRHAELLVAAMLTAIERIKHETELTRRNERLEEFTSVVSHDLRSPLSVASGRIDLAVETGDFEHLEAASTALDRMEQLIGDMLSLARHGEAVGDLEVVSLPAVVSDAWSTVATASAELAVTTERSVLADRSRLAQLVENLVRNAVEHGGSDVSVVVGDLEDGFFVADDGPGIAPDERSAVFEAGYTASAEGTGFGLAIVKEIAEAHGWSVAVTEADGGGARFEVSGVTFEG